MAQSLILLGNRNGITIVPMGTELSRLNYFDGKFLKAADLQAEQLYLRRLVFRSNEADGGGCVSGFNLALASGGRLSVSPGLAIDPVGRVLLLQEQQSLDIEELIRRTREGQAQSAAVTAAGGKTFGQCITVADAPGAVVQENVGLYLITVGHAEALCGEEDVYGSLCEAACVTSVNRPRWIEGVIVRARPLVLTKPLPVSTAVLLARLHLRSRVASAYFETERAAVASLISGQGLASAVWCAGAEAQGGSEVPLGVLARAGSSNVFLDGWTVRRERMDTPPKRYWQWRMAMRPWDVFLAQVLQFQCQLRDILDGVDGGSDDDPCRKARTAVEEAVDVYPHLLRFYREVSGRLSEMNVATTDAIDALTRAGGVSFLGTLERKLVLANQGPAKLPLERILINGGIIELPSAGYLPVTPGAELSVNAQVRRWMGEGVDLRFCVVRPDFIPHALEEAQHMERISLLQGIDDPQNKPEVDILVPDGELSREGATTGAMLFEAALNEFNGTASFVAENGGLALRLAVGSAPPPENLEPNRSYTYNRFVNTANDARELARSRLVAADEPAAMVLAPDPEGPVSSIWASLTLDRDPFALPQGGQVRLEVDYRLVTRTRGTDESHSFLVVKLFGKITSQAPASGGQGLSVVRGVLAPFGETRTQNSTKPLDTTPRQFEMLRTELPGGRMSYKLSLDSGGSRDAIALEFGGDPVTAVIAFGSSLAGSANRTTRITLTENSRVSEAANPLRTTALASLSLIEAIVDEPGFHDEAARLLFPAPRGASDALRVLATRDWVLFHRRRTKNCGLDEAPPAPPVTRKYMLYHFPVSKGTSVAELRKLLRGGTPIPPSLGVEPVGMVDFAGGLPTLATPVADLLQDWRAVQPFSRIVYGAIGSEGPAETEGEPLARSRVTALEAALAPESTPAPGAPMDLLPGAPLLVAGSDGSIILATEAELQEIAVYLVPSNIDMGMAVERALQNRLDEPSDPVMAIRAGSTNFVKGETEPMAGGPDQVKQTWAEVAASQPFGAAYLSQAIDGNTMRSLAAPILAAIGGASTIPINPVMTSASLNPKPELILLFSARPQRQTVVPRPEPPPADRVIARVVPARRSDSGLLAADSQRESLVTFDAAGELAVPLSRDISGNPNFLVRRVELRVEGTPDTASRRRMKAFVAALEAANLVVRSASGAIQTRAVVASLNPEDRALLTGGATEAIFLEIDG